MKKDIFKSKVQKVIDSGKSLCVIITIPGQDTFEYIINSADSIENKFKYYLNAYDDDMCHVMNTLIQIIGVSGVDCLELSSGDDEKEEN